MVDIAPHTLFVRTQDTSGRRSINSARPFLKEAINAADAAPDIIAIDYYFVHNTDATPTPISTYNDFEPSADLEAEFALNLAGLGGDYTTFIVARDALGRTSQAVDAIAAATHWPPELTSTGCKSAAQMQTPRT